jgi:hypothetical protein
VDRKNEFTGGIFHAFRHFSYKDIPLSTMRANYNLPHPHNILFHIIRAFFINGLTLEGPKSKGLAYVSTIPYQKPYSLKFVFFQEPNTITYFLDTAHAVKLPVGPSIT